MTILPHNTKAEFTSNGFIIQENSPSFHGFAGLHGQDVWPLYYEDEKISELNQFLDKYVILETYQDNWVDLCTDIHFIKKYYDECISRGKQVEILYCMTTRQKPVCPPSLHNHIISNAEFLGYDYAYPGMDYYSAVFEDVFTKRIAELQQYPLNKFGLFEKLQEVYNFANQRAILAQETDLDFEQGEFIVFKLWRASKLNKLIEFSADKLQGQDL